MTKKQAKRNSYGKSKKTTIKFLEQQPMKFAAAICPINIEEQKERFLKHGKVPKFVMKGDEDEIEQLYNKSRNQIRFDLFGEAQYVLTTVKEKFGDSENYLTYQFGERVSKEVATDILADYLKENGIDGAMSIIWCNDLASAARMMWVGPHVKNNRPEARNYSLWIKNSDDNPYLRQHGIKCLANHEIGTHFFRMFNDGLQPWFSDRKRFGIRGLSSLEQLRSEEGLAAINTILNAKERYLWGPALLYYTACKAAEMSFKQLFDHLSQYVTSPEQRWRYCMRVKRGLLDLNDIGGYGKDQCYFEGAVEILRNLDKIEFHVFMSGKICIDEIQRCKRIARTDCVKIPSFMRNEKKYKKMLLAVANLNGLHLRYPDPEPPLAYIHRLKRGRRIGPSDGSKVRKRGRGWRKAGYPAGCSGSSTDSDTGDYDTGLAIPSPFLGGRTATGVASQSKDCDNDTKQDSNNKRVDSGIVSDVDSGPMSGKEALSDKENSKSNSNDNILGSSVHQFDKVSYVKPEGISFTTVQPFSYEDSELSLLSGENPGFDNVERCISAHSIRSSQSRISGIHTSITTFPDGSLANFNSGHANKNSVGMFSKIGDSDSTSKDQLVNVESLTRDSGTHLNNFCHLTLDSNRDSENHWEQSNEAKPSVNANKFQSTSFSKGLAALNSQCGGLRKISPNGHIFEKSHVHTKDAGTDVTRVYKKKSDTCVRDSGTAIANHTQEMLNNCVRDSGLLPRCNSFKTSKILPPSPAKPNHDMSTTIIVDDEVAGKDTKSHRNGEVILPCLPAQWHASSFSYLTDIKLCNMSGAKDLESPVFHSCVDNSDLGLFQVPQNGNANFHCQTIQNVVEYGPEKFIYPESSTSQIMKLATPGAVKDLRRFSLLSSASRCPSASFSNHLPHLHQRRAKSAINCPIANSSICKSSADNPL